MSWIYRHVIRPILFARDSESIHEQTLAALARVHRSEFACEALAAFCRPPDLPVEVFGLRFPNPVGLAAGMDKFAAAPRAWEALGFGFSELGGVTWHTQPGNPPPRLFRAIPDRALVNRMGFNNPGAAAFAQALTRWRASGLWPQHPVGINLGKSKITPLEQSAGDYASSFRLLRDLADFFVINVSSPNTPNLRQLQDKVALDEILAAMNEMQHQNPEVQRLPLRGVAPQARPILVKVSPDLEYDALDEILEVAVCRNIAGIVATNSTTSRPESVPAGLALVYSETGGLSGAPLRARSTEVIRHLYRQTKGSLPIIGVGGIFSAADAWEKIAAGASLIQVYTGLVYEGPGLASRIVSGLSARLSERGLSSIRAAIGCGRA